MLIDQGQVVAAMDRDANKGAVRAQAPVGGDQVRVGVVREIRVAASIQDAALRARRFAASDPSASCLRVEGLQDRHDAGLDVVLAEGLTEEVGEDLGGQAAQLAEQDGIVVEEGTDALGDGDAAETSAASSIGPDVTMTAEGIEWVVSGALSSMLQIQSVSCKRPVSTKKDCSVTVKLPMGWDYDLVNVYSYDRDGVRENEQLFNFKSARPGDLVKDRVFLNSTAVRVIVEP